MIKGIAYVAKRKPGKPVRHYFYAWRGGPCIMTRVGGPKPKLDDSAHAAYREAVNAGQSERDDMFPGLIRLWRASNEWKALAPSTRKNWDGILDKIEAKWSATSVKLWSDPRMVRTVMTWRDSNAATPRAADNGVTVLRALLEWARLRGRVTVNVATGIPALYHGGDRAEIIWTDDDIAALATYANQGVMDAVKLACLTGLRLADLAGLEWAEIGDTAILRIALKSSRHRRRKAVVPIYPELAALLDELRTRYRRNNVSKVLVTSAGNAWSSDGLGKRVGEARTKAGIVHDDGRPKHLHDCRGTFATKLILLGLTDQEAADIMAWSPARVANIRKVYVDRMRIVVALADRLSGTSTNRAANRGGA